MMTVNKLQNTGKLVKKILEADEQARNSDSFLYFRVLGVLGAEKGLDLNLVPVTVFLLKMKEWGFPPFESVRRARQRVQAEFPELASCRKIEALRMENEKKYRAFAVGGVPHE